jgi:Na+-transporting methylmalonyl-CoA/oxaloacetate decarboxylase beta subunit
VEIFWEFLQAGLIGNFAWGNMAMLAIGCTFIYLGIAKDYEPLLLVPIGFGMLVGNIPLTTGMNVGIYEENSVLHILYNGGDPGLVPRP